MASLQVFDWNKKEVGKLDANATIFDTEVRKDILHSVVRWQLACKRQGTHKAKTRGEVRGGGKKPFKQKGTGNARQGSTRSPINEGGGVIFGPSPRDYSYTLPKKTRAMGMKSALSYLNKEGRLFVVKTIESSDGKTKAFSDQLKTMGLTKALIVDESKNDMVSRASKNLGKFKYITVPGVNVYDLLKFDNLVITESAIKALENRLK